MVVSTERKSKDERREDILDAAIAEFAAKGLHGASTDEIARLAGISQPYVFRLFGTKKELYLAVIARCFRETLEIFQRVAEGKRGEEALYAHKLHVPTSCARFAEAQSMRLRQAAQTQFGGLAALERGGKSTERREPDYFDFIADRKGRRGLVEHVGGCIVLLNEECPVGDGMRDRSADLHLHRFAPDWCVGEKLPDAD